MHTYITWVIRHRFIVVILLIIVTATFMAIVSQGRFANSLGKVFFGEHHLGYARYVQRIREFVSDEVVMILYHNEQILSEHSLQKLEQAVESLEALPEVARVDSLLNLQHIYGNEETLYVETYADEALEQSELAEDILKTLTQDPLYSDLLISEDGQHAVVLIELVPGEGDVLDKTPSLIKAILGCFDRAGFESEHLGRVGFVVTLGELVTQSIFNVAVLFPVIGLIVFVAVFVLFRRLWPVFITLGVSCIAVIWTFGFAVLLDKQINVYTTMVPGVILIVATSDIIHLCHAYLMELAKGRQRSEAIIHSGYEVGTACFWTSATTFFGFLALAFVPVTGLRQLGLTMGFGVAIALLLSMTICPVLFSLMKAPNVETYTTSWAQTFLEHVLLKTEQAVFHHPWRVIGIFLIVGVVALGGVLRLEVESNIVERLRKTNRVRQDEAYYNQHFAGANSLDIFIEAAAPQGILDPQLFSRIAAFHHTLAQRPEIDKVTSLVDLMTSIDRALNAGHTTFSSNAYSRELLTQYLLLFEMSGGEDVERLVDFERTTLRMHVRLKDFRTIATYMLGTTIERMGRETFWELATVEATGINYLLGDIIDEIVTGQQHGFLFACGTIVIMMSMSVRSWKIGSWAMLPNLLPLGVMAGILGYLFHTIDADTVIPFIIAIGIGVDDTIHFLSRLRFESQHAPDADTALKRAFHFSGRAMVTTTIILVAGFLPFAWSSYLPLRMYGTVLPLTLITAVAADLLLVPAMVKIGLIRFSFE